MAKHRAERPDWVLGLDPGLTTGWALLRLPGDEEQLECGERPFDETCHSLEMVLAALRHQRVVVACERFNVGQQTAKNAPAPWSVEVTGVARFLCGKYGAELVIQQRNAAKKFATNDRLRALEWYERGQPHARDAARQVLLYLSEGGFLSPTRRDKLFTLNEHE